jgi:hypothetical protein
LILLYINKWIAHQEKIEKKIKNLKKPNFFYLRRKSHRKDGLIATNGIDQKWQTVI